MTNTVPGHENYVVGRLDYTMTNNTSLFARYTGGGPGYLKLFDSNLPFDPHDLAGIWSPNGNGFGGGGRCRDCGDRGYSFEFPVFTPAGQAAFDQEHPVIRQGERQRRREGAPGRAHRPEAGPASGARQRHVWHVQSDGNAAGDPLPRPGRVHRRCPIASISISSGAMACERSGPMAASFRSRTTSICRGGGDTRPDIGTATRSSSIQPATTSARGSTTSAIRTAMRWCCRNDIRAPTTTRSS